MFPCVESLSVHCTPRRSILHPSYRGLSLLFALCLVQQLCATFVERIQLACAQTRGIHLKLFFEVGDLDSISKVFERGLFLPAVSFLPKASREPGTMVEKKRKAGAQESERPAKKSQSNKVKVTHLSSPDIAKPVVGKFQGPHLVYCDHTSSLQPH